VQDASTRRVQKRQSHIREQVLDDGGLLADRIVISGAAQIRRGYMQTDLDAGDLAVSEEFAEEVEIGPELN